VGDSNLRATSGQALYSQGNKYGKGKKQWKGKQTGKKHACTHCKWTTIQQRTVGSFETVGSESVRMTMWFAITAPNLVTSVPTADFGKRHKSYENGVNH